MPIFVQTCRESRKTVACCIFNEKYLLMNISFMTYYVENTFIENEKTLWNVIWMIFGSLHSRENETLLIFICNSCFTKIGITPLFPVSLCFFSFIFSFLFLLPFLSVSLLLSLSLSSFISLLSLSLHSSFLYLIFIIATSSQ